eukprot:10802911-Karenia_brevis.AAC.1
MTMTMTMTMTMIMIMIMTMIMVLMSPWGGRSPNHPQAFDQGHNTFGGTPGSFLVGMPRRRCNLGIHPVGLMA